MNDPLELLDRLATRKRRRLLNVFFGAASGRPESAFVSALAAEAGTPDREPDFFAVDVELDAIASAFLGASFFGDPELPPFHDKRGIVAFDGLCVDAVAAYRREGEGSPIALILMEAKSSGKWGGRNFRVLTARLRDVFGEDGKGLIGAAPIFVALGPDRPVPTKTAAWAPWMRRGDGSSLWLPYGRTKEELRTIRCDRRGRPRRMGDCWKIV